MKELLVRTLSGAVYVALVLGAAWAGAWATGILFLVVAILASLELRGLFLRTNRPVENRTYTICLIVFFYGLVPLVVLLKHPGPMTPALIGLVLLSILAGAFWKNQPRALGFFYAALALYLAFPLLCATWMVAYDHLLFIGFLLLLWTNDTGAYIVGKSIGRNKLMPTVSPGKTWEGLLGGIALTVLVGWLWSKQCDSLAPSGWIVAAAVVSITATIGDLLESWMKRRAGVKDSGTIMPGHGGVLDRFDGYLVAAPAMVLVVLLLK